MVSLPSTASPDVCKGTGAGSCLFSKRVILALAIHVFLVEDVAANVDVVDDDDGGALVGFDVFLFLLFFCFVTKFSDATTGDVFPNLVLHTIE